MPRLEVVVNSSKSGVAILLLVTCPMIPIGYIDSLDKTSATSVYNPLQYPGERFGAKERGIRGCIFDFQEVNIMASSMKGEEMAETIPCLERNRQRVCGGD